MSELEGQGVPEASVNDSASLERGYRRLLAWYPSWFRRENEEEILAVLMACAQDDQVRPSREAAADLLKGAVKMRLRPRPGQPRTVYAAVWLMIAGAVVGAANLVILRATEGEIKAAVIAKYPAYAHALGHLVSVQVTIDEATGPIGIGVLLWLAWMNGTGRQRGRVGFAVFFGITSLGALYSLSQGAVVYAPAAMGVGLGSWATTAAAMMLLFNKASSPYFQRREPVLV